MWWPLKKKNEVDPLKRQENEQKHQGSRWKLVDVSPVKDFIDYGMSKTLMNLKLRRMKDIEVRETLMKRGEDRDWGKTMGFILTTVIIGVICFMLITQFLNYNDATTAHAACEVLLGQCQGQGGQCVGAVING